MSIRSGYDQRCRQESDIYEHLPTLRRYASECKTVTECGVRSCVSTYAFADALQGRVGTHLTQVDIQDHENIHAFQALARNEGLASVFHKESSLTCPLTETDLLFIDTWHVYAQLKRELARWHSYTKKYIILHDTTVDEFQGETIRNGWNAEQQARENNFPVHEILQGLWPAVTEFLEQRPEWVLHERFTNNNGLTVLKRIK